MMQINLTGQILGGYALREVIGIGGMGVVYSAYQATLKREVAVKVLLVDLSLDAESAERFNREAEISAALEHPHIVPIIDHGTYQSIAYVVMRLLTGGTLAQRIQKRIQTNTPLPSFGEIVKMLNQLAGALDYAHAHNVIHRDIKPNNIMFDQVGNAYLVDFGIAKLHGITSSGITGTGMVIGTYPYMPPEQWRGDMLTSATDQYALGVIAYSLITGHLPFNADTPYQFMHKHLHEEPLSPRSFRADISSELEQVLKKVMAKEAQDRYSSVAAFAEAFENAVGTDKGVNTDYFTFKLPRPVLPQAGVASTPPPVGSQPVTLAEPITLPNNSPRRIPLWLVHTTTLFREKRHGLKKGEKG